MYTAVSWYLHATKDADETKFLTAIENWLLDRNQNYGFKFQKNSLKNIISFASVRVIEGDKATLQIAKGVDKSNSYIAFSLDNEDKNVLWIVECVFRQSLDKNDGCFFVTLSKRINDPEHPGSHSRNISIPKFAEYLIQEGVATKEKGEEYVRVLSLNNEDALHEDIYRKLVNSPNNNYPIVVINRAYVKENGCRIISELCSLCHIRVINDKNEKWAYKVIYPRLQYYAEYYANEQWKEVGKSVNDTEEIRRVFYPRKQIQETPYQIRQELITLVNEGISHLTYMDYNSTIDTIKKHNTSTVFISQELANRLKEARKLRDLTQNELAELANAEFIKDNSQNNTQNEETPITGLLVSRIETRRVQCVDSKKMLIIEKCLQLPAYQLIGLTSKEKSSMSSKPSEESLSSEANTTRPPTNDSGNGDEKPNYCWNCGSKLRFSGMRFCSQCGNRLSE